jgi:integrase
VTSDTFIEPKEKRVTVDDLLDALAADYQLRGGKRHVQFQSHLKPIRSAFGHLRAVDVTETTIDRYMKQRLEEGKKPATVNRETQLLGQAFRLGHERRFVQRIPHIRHLPERNARQGFFEQDEFEQVVKYLPDYLNDIAHFAYLSGWRKGEIAQLQWVDVDRQARVIRLCPASSKTHEGRVLALHGELWDLIERRREVRGTIPWVFHRQGFQFQISDFKKAWRTACKKAGVPGKLFHDLRRTAVRNMMRAGVPERVAMAISGHKTRSIFDRYNIVNEDDLRDAMSKTETYLKNSSRTIPAQNDKGARE